MHSTLPDEECLVGSEALVVQPQGLVLLPERDISSGRHGSSISASGMDVWPIRNPLFLGGVFV